MATNDTSPDSRHTLDQINWCEVKQSLQDLGYAVIKGVLRETECDEYISNYMDWLSQFDEEADEAPFHIHSLIQRYRIGHFKPSWSVRLKAKPVFSKIWKTEKLLSSFDAVAIGKPPEVSDQSFAKEGEKWLHLDQGKYRRGLHAYQGAVYLEETTETDWVFRVLTKSHKHHELFYDSHPMAGKGRRDDFYKLKDPEIAWFRSKGCELTKVPVPKGGMVLWDSRLVHDSVRPEHGRPNSDRWRFVVFVSMTPAIWANERDMNERRTAYKRMFLTTHWASQGVEFFPDKKSDFPWKKITTIEKLPDVARTEGAQLLAGIQSYDFEDGKPNGDDMYPCWTMGDYSDKATRK